MKLAFGKLALFAAGIVALLMGSRFLLPSAAAQSVTAPKAPSSAVAPPADFKLAVQRELIGAGNGGSATQPAQDCPQISGDAALEAYRQFLAKRLERPVVICGFATQSDVTTAMLAQKVDMAVLQPESGKPAQAGLRAILAPRFEPLSGRVLGVALAMKSSGITSLNQRPGLRPIFIGTEPPSRAIILEGITDHGFDVTQLADEVIADENTGYAALKSNRGDVLLVTAGARQRVCRAIDQKTGCDDLIELWRGRPTAPVAFVVRNEMAEADRYQLVGVHVAMHKQNPEAFAFIAKLMPGAIMLDPTEAGALVKGPR
jgi:ABC-type phosphate/phosphonate transport system substrate-binding protein